MDQQIDAGARTIDVRTPEILHQASLVSRGPPRC
jgi:hypothetical protein